MAQVRLILKEDVDNLGDAGDLVSVKPGYARNFLLPQGKALIATKGRVKELEHHQRIIEERQARALEALESVRKQLEGTEVEIAATAGDAGRLFGSVTMQRVAEALQEKGIEADRRKLSVAEAIKSVGEHTVSLKLHRELSVDIRVKVVPSETSAAAPRPEPEDAAEVETSLTRDDADASGAEADGGDENEAPAEERDDD